MTRFVLLRVVLLVHFAIPSYLWRRAQLSAPEPRARGIWDDDILRYRYLRERP